MNYLEKVLNDRIEELKKENEEIINGLKEKLNNNALDCYFDIEECYMCLDANEIRITELELLKNGLGLVPVQELSKKEEE